MDDLRTAELYGRQPEQDALAALLDAARCGRSGALVLRGEPGIGKTALLDHAAARAKGMRVLRGTGVEVESELPFAGLQLLLRPALGALGALPEPQRASLEAALGLGAAGDRDAMLTGLAVLSLLAEHAGEGGLLCLVDDAQWLDQASQDALLFAARRLYAEGVALVFAARDGEGSFPAAGLPERRLAGLTPEAAAALLDRRPAGEGSEQGISLSPTVRYRVLAEAHGNPLALHELPLALAAESPGGFSPGALPLTGRLQLAFHGQVSRLPQTVQDLLLLAAVDETGDPEVLLRAAGAVGAGIDDLVRAEETGLLVRRAGAAVADGSLPESVTFRHPLIRAAVHQRAPLGRRLAAHRALATTLTEPSHADRRAWHLAAAATGPDAEAATALEETASRARARSGHEAAAAAYERAARLTADPAERARRETHAAESALAAGRLERAVDLARRAAERGAAGTDAAAGGDTRLGGRAPHDGDAVSGGPARQDGATSSTAAMPGSTATTPGDAALGARTAHVRALAAFWQGSYPAAHQLLLNGAALVRDSDPAQAAAMLIQSVHPAWYLGERPLSETLTALEAVSLPEPHPLAPLARFVARLLDRGRTGPPPVLRDALDAIRGRGGKVPDEALMLLCGAALARGQDADAHRLATELAAEQRAAGAAGRLPTVLFFVAEGEVFTGRHRDARTTAAEALALARDTGQEQWTGQFSSVLAYLAAAEGDEEACRRHAETGLTGGAAGALAPGAPWAHWSLGLLELGLGRAESALSRFERLTREPMRHHFCALRSTPDLVEAAVRVGAPDRAADALTRFAEWTGSVQQDWAQALLHRCHALLAIDDGAEQHYADALRTHDRDGRPLEYARTALLYGEWLRRSRRKAEARAQLDDALDVFDRLAMRPWAERTRAELTATGTGTRAEQTTAPTHGAAAGLTPQELQIVRLAAQGLSNRDIAAQLFLSHRTVGYHLYKAYPKLGIASRAELKSLAAREQL
ncbi:AAA family ATPase [Streptomyces sp. A7024]|uniref:AAA family ATPase n=1 Tax=Streptomyces coryli TaxID=1128680 RepID=A0A6G4TXM9_9ACTN|nr:LuxR family transcriptional regulator [Streptomyces coryli]NGN64522.1 AAA family ATPase [Streptomyces coryli]